MTSQIKTLRGEVGGGGDALQVCRRELEAREWEACKNPMLIDVILDNMFGFLDFEDLAQCRRVSKQWHKMSLPSWLTKGPTLKLGLKPTERSYWILPEHVKRTMMSDFLELVYNEFHSYGPYEYSGLRQYKKFEVVGEATHQLQNQTLRHFLQICGDAVTELKVELQIKDSDTYRALMLSTMCPNLVKLSGIMTFEGGDLQKGTFEVMEEEHRTLTSLQIGYRADEDYSLSNLPASGWIQLLKRYSNLKTLFVGDRWVTMVPSPRRVPPDMFVSQVGSDRLLRTLSPLFRDGQLKMSLETLVMCIGKATLSQTIADLLASQAPTLKNLSFYDNYRDAPLQDFKPPELPFLASLELHGRPIRNLDSLARFQSLKSLCLTYTKVRGGLIYSDHLPKMLGGTRQQEGGLIVPTLAKFHCNYGRATQVKKNPLRPGDVRLLARFFPNLTDLQLWLDNMTLDAVIQSWPGLQHLTIIGAMVDDRGISGVVRDFPRMKDLKSLAMKQFEGATALTEKSLVKFLKLPNLERLEISLDEQLSVGPAIMRKLEEKITTFKLTRPTNLERNDTDSLDDDDWDGEDDDWDEEDDDWDEEDDDRDEEEDDDWDEVVDDIDDNSDSDNGNAD